MVGSLGHSILKIAIIEDSGNIFSEKIKNIYNEDLEFVYESKDDFKGLIIVSRKLNFDQKNIIHKSNILNLPIIGIQDGFDALNLFFGGNQSVETKDSASQIFLSPGAKLSHIVGGSGWVKGDLELIKTIYSKDLSETFFSSIISDKGEILGFEKPGEKWQFGLRFDILSQEIPRGFENILNVFLDKCSE